MIPVASPVRSGSCFEPCICKSCRSRMWISRTWIPGPILCSRCSALLDLTNTLWHETAGRG